MNFKELPGIILALDADRKVFFSNNGYANLPEGNGPNPPPYAMISPLSKDSVKSACQRVLETETEYKFEMGEMKPNGPENWFQFTVTPIRGSADKTVMALAIGIEITESKKEEYRLRRSEKLLVDAQDVAHLGTWEYFLGGTEVIWSDELYRIYGEDPEKFKPTFEGFIAKVHPDDRDRVLETMTKVFIEHISFSHDERIVRPDKSVRHLHTWGHPIYDESGRATQLIGVCQDITEQKMMEERLHAEEKLRKLIFNTVCDVLFYIKVDAQEQFRFLSVNDAFLKATGLAAAQVIGRRVDEVIPEPSLSLVKEKYKESIREHKTCQWDEITDFPAGKKYGEVAVVPVLENNVCIGLVGTVHDITERREHQTRIEKALSFEEAALESTADGILVVGINEDITGFNQKFLELWNIPKQELQGRGYRWALNFVLDQLRDADHCLKRLQEIKANPDHEFYDILEFKDGRIFERYTRPQRIRGQPVGHAFSYRDITERKRAEEQTKQYARRLKFLAEIARDFAETPFDLHGVLNITAKKIAEFFEAGCIVRLSGEHKKWPDITSCYHINTALNTFLNHLTKEPTILIDEESTNQVNKTGKSKLVSVSKEQAFAKIHKKFWPHLERFPIHTWMIAPLLVAGRTIGTLKVFGEKEGQFTKEDLELLHELADRTAITINNAQLYLDAQKAIQLREDFMAMASHELKTPLTPLKMQLQLLTHFTKAGVINVGPQAKDLQTLIANSDKQIVRLTRLVEDMLDASHLRTGRFTLNIEKCDLIKIVENVVEVYQGQLNTAKCELVIDAPAPIVGNWDRLRIEQVISNLLSNAIKYGSSKPIRISVKMDEKNKTQTAILKIHDEGIGISKEDREKIFERFGRAASVKSFGGLGMGLYISKEIVEAHDGTINVESTPNQSSTFTVTLPLSN